MSSLPDEHREFRGEPGLDPAALRGRILSLIPEAIAGELEPELQELVERHVGRDLSLAREWEAQRRACAALQSLAEGGDEDPGFDDVFFGDLHRGIVHAIQEDQQLDEDLRTLQRHAGRSGLRLRLGAAWSRLRNLPSAFAHAFRPHGRALKLAPRLAMAAACVFLGLFLGRFLASDSVLVPVSGGPNAFEEGGPAVPTSGLDQGLQADIEKVYAEIKALPAPTAGPLPGLGPVAPASEPESLASAEGGVDL